MNKGQTTFFAKALVLVASVVVFAIIIANTQSFFGGTVEKKQRSMFEIGVTATAQKLITTKECLAYSFNNTVEKGVLDIKKIEEFSKNYKNEEPYCAPAYPFDYSIEIRQIPTNFSIYPKMSGPSVGVMLVLDESGSMDCCQSPGYRGSRLYKKCCGEKEIMEPIDERWEEKLNGFKNCTKAFINALEEDDKAGLVTYSSTVKRSIAPTVNHQQILNAIERIRPSARGEYEITDAIGKLIEMDLKVGIAKLDGWWMDIGSPGDLLRANERILKENEKKFRVRASVVKTRTFGEIDVPENSHIEGSILEGPVVVGENVRIVGSKVGPNVSLSDGVSVEGSVLENSIIMRDSRIENTILMNSVIGEKVSIVGNGEKMKILIGDCGKLEIFE